MTAFLKQIFRKTLPDSQLPQSILTFLSGCLAFVPASWPIHQEE